MGKRSAVPELLDAPKEVLLKPLSDHSLTLLLHCLE